MSNRLKLIREKATRPRRTVDVVLDGEVVAQIEAVEDALGRLDGEAKKSDRRMSTKSDEAERTKLLAELDHLVKSAEDMTVHLVFEGLPGTAYQALTAQHPPRKDEAGNTLVTDLGGVNGSTFRVPVIRACVIGQQERPHADAPVLPIDDELREMLDFMLGAGDEPPFLTDRQIQVLAQAAIDVNRRDDAVPLQRRRSANGTSASA